jgi:UDP-N-acetylglucosamine diphosphorylase/glucosamine-1-phosphate N-acetyltransferase
MEFQMVVIRCASIGGPAAADWGLDMSKRFGDVAVVILAAGLGTRMKSERAKVLHEILGRPMILYVVDTARAVVGDHVVLVVGHQAKEVERTVAAQADLHYAYQEQQLGTGHAVMCAMPSIPEGIQHVVILCGDVPLLKKDTLGRFVEGHRSQGRTLSILAVDLDDPTGYGRIVQADDATVIGIVEEADATPAQRTISTVNTGIYCVERNFLTEALGKIGDDNVQGEYYLTDIVAAAHRENRDIGISIGNNPDEFVGINSREQLEAVEHMLQSGHELA